MWPPRSDPSLGQKRFAPQMLSHCLQPNVSLPNTTLVSRESFLTQQEQMVKCSQQSAKDFFDQCHKQDVHMTMSSPSNIDTSRWFTLKCSHFQVLHTPATSRCPPPSVSHCSHKELCSPSTHGGVDGGSAERQLRSCCGRDVGAAPEGATRVAAGNAFLPDVREAYLESEKPIWSQKRLFGVRKAYLESKRGYLESEKPI